MANWEHQLISSILRADEPPEAFREAMESGIENKVFGAAEARTLWSGIKHYYNRADEFGKIPSLELLNDRYGQFDLPEPQEDFSDLCRLVMSKYRDRVAERAWDKYQKDRSVSPEDALVGLQSTLTGLNNQLTGKSDVIFSEVIMGETLEELENLETTEGITGIPYPWEPLNQATGGIQDGDYIMVYGLPKSMKTWLGLIMAVYLANTGRRVLIYSKEMQWPSLRKRINCLQAELDYTTYKNGKLSMDEKGHLLDTLANFISGPGEIIFTDATKANGEPGGPEEIREKINIYSPHFVLLDSAYMLELGGKNGGINALDWKSLQTVNRLLKNISKTTGIPMLAILQENERAALKYKGTRGTASLSMNTQAVQDCDLALRVVYNKYTQEQAIHIAAARETLCPGFTINAVACTNFRYAHDKLFDIDDCSPEQNEATEEDERAKIESVNKMAKSLSMMDSFAKREQDG